MPAAPNPAPAPLPALEGVVTSRALTGVVVFDDFPAGMGVRAAGVGLVAAAPVALVEEGASPGAGARAATGRGVAAVAAWPGMGRARARRAPVGFLALGRGLRVFSTLAARSGSVSIADEMVAPASSSAVFATNLPTGGGSERVSMGRNRRGQHRVGLTWVASGPLCRWDSRPQGSGPRE